MTTTENISNIFSILHDGTISAWMGNKDLLYLTIECEYLAERIDKSFDRFYVELIDIEKLELNPWTNSIELPTIINTTYADIFKAELEILSAEVIDDIVVITCNQHDKNFDYCGGNLAIRCKEVKVYDQNKNELTIDQLGDICKIYWEQE